MGCQNGKLVAYSPKKKAGDFVGHGVAPASSQVTPKEAEARSRKINQKIKKDFIEESEIVKLLLLGAGESGKSTIVKQMKLLHPVNNRSKAGFSEEEKVDAKFAILSNITEAILTLVDAVDTLEDIQVDQKSQGAFTSASDIVRHYAIRLPAQQRRRNWASAGSGGPGDGYPAPGVQVLNALKFLWTHQDVQRAFERRSEFQLGDSASYFLDDLDRICSGKKSCS